MYNVVQGERTSVASAYFLSWYCLVPSGTSLRGLKVRVFPLPIVKCVGDRGNE